MRPPEQGAYLTLSASAVREFFDGDIRGLRLRTVGDVITMKGVQTTSGADVVSVEHRGRGGLFAHIDEGGRASNELFQLFRDAGYRSTSPYFLLRPRPREWVGIEHWTSRNPPLNQPFMRVWMSETRRRGRKAAATPKRRATRQQSTVDTGENLDWRQIRRVLAADQAVIERERNDTGRGNARRTMARRNLEQFERLVELILPGHEDLASLQARLERVSTQLDQAQRERESAMEELVALQRVLDDERRERRANERNKNDTTTERPRESRKRRREFQQPRVTEEDILAAGGSDEAVEPSQVETPPSQPPPEAAETETDRVEEATEVEAEKEATEGEMLSDEAEAAAEAAQAEDFVSDETTETGSDESNEREGVAEANEPTEGEDGETPETEGETGTAQEPEQRNQRSRGGHDDQPPAEDLKFPDEKN